MVVYAVWVGLFESTFLGGSEDQRDGGEIQRCLCFYGKIGKGRRGKNGVRGRTSKEERERGEKREEEREEEEEKEN